MKPNRHGAFLILLTFLVAACTAGEEAPPFSPAGEAAGPSAVGAAVDRTEAVVGELLYVPVYSHIYYGDGGREFLLTATLSIRNTDPERPIDVMAVRYYDSEGRLVRGYLEQPRRLRPLGSIAMVVEEADRTGGVGANFLVEWHAETAASPLVVEAVMISTAGSQGISFVSPGRVIRRLE